MRTSTGLWNNLVDPDALADAARRTVRGKRLNPEVAWFWFRRDAALGSLREELVSAAWRPAPFDLLLIRDPKRRVIAKASIEDRIVHTALVDGLWSAFGRSTLPEDMACRPGGGTHRAVLALQRGLRHHRFALHLDVASFFPSIDVDGLIRLVRARIRDPRFLQPLERTLDAGRGIYDRPAVRAFAGWSPQWPPPGRGLPLGAHTSQFLATHVVLNALDHHLKRALKVPTYVRYVDDLFMFGDRRADLRAWRVEVGRWLAEERGLLLKHPDAPIVSCAGTLHALGHRITRNDCVPTRRAWRRFTHRMRRLAFTRKRGWRLHVRRVVASSVAFFRGPTS